MTLRASACVNSPARRTASTFCQGDRGLTSYRRLRLLLRLFDALVPAEGVAGGSSAFAAPRGARKLQPLLNTSPLVVWAQAEARTDFTLPRTYFDPTRHTDGRVPDCQ